VQLPPPPGATPPRPDGIAGGGEPWPVATWTVPELILLFLMPFGLSWFVGVLLGGVLRLRGEGFEVVATVLQELTFLTPILWVRRTGRGSIEAFGWRSPSGGAVARGIGYGLLTLISSGVLTVIVLELAHEILGYTPEVPNVLDRYHGAWAIVGSIAAVALAPVCEEVLFRGVLFGGLRRRFAFWPAAAISASVFAAVHGDPVRLPALFVAGVLLAAVFERTRRLAAPMVAHLTLNLIAVLLAASSR
jgi:membrane protease YdiL (CAAX protease family)